MKFVITVKNMKTGNTHTEDYEVDVDDAQKWAEETISRFNATLRPFESPRELVSVEIIGDVDNLELHDWDKDITGMSANFRGTIVDKMRCKHCGITGKRYGLGRSTIKIDSKYRKKVFRKCNTACVEMGRVRV